MSLIYPRMIAVSRPPEATGAGDQGYPTATPADEDNIASNVPASIQQRRSGGSNPANLPGDARVTSHRIFIPASALALGTIKKRDIITDDLDVRYQVDSPYWNGLGYRLECVELET